MKVKRFIQIFSIFIITFFISCENEEILDEAAIDHQILITYPNDNEEVF